MELEKMLRRLAEGENAASLQALTESEAGARLAGALDGAAVERAVRSGDDAALRSLLEGVLKTPEGRAFAAGVREAMDGHGR